MRPIVLILTGTRHVVPGDDLAQHALAAADRVFLHSVAALFTVGGVMIHIYMSVSNVPGSLQSND